MPNSAEANSAKHPKKVPGTTIPSIRATLETPPQCSKFVFPYFLQLNQMTLVRYDPRVDPRSIYLTLAIYTASGAVLPLFGAGAGVPVVICDTSKGETAQHDTHSLVGAVLKKLPDVDPEAVQEKISYLNQEGTEWGHYRFDDEVSRQNFEQGIPGDAVIFVYSLEPWLQGELTAEKREDALQWLQTLGRRGNTVVVFELQADASAQSPMNDTYSDIETVELAYDPDAPHEIGGGCIVHRPRRGYFDDRPYTFNYWYMLVEGVFDWSFEMRADIDPIDSKVAKRQKRRIRVAQYKKAGMNQRAMAKALDVHESTIHHDLKALAEKWD